MQSFGPEAHTHISALCSLCTLRVQKGIDVEWAGCIRAYKKAGEGEEGKTSYI